MKIDYLFTNDKCKQNRTKASTDNVSTEITHSKSSLVELRSSVKALIQTIHDLESMQTKCEETSQCISV